MNNKTPLFLVFLTVFVDLLGFGILIPILPIFATIELHVDEAAVGIAIAIYSFTQFFFNPIFGKLSDKYGRKPIIVISLLLNALGYIIFAYTSSYIILLVSRVVAGIGGSSIGVAQAYIADVTEKKDRAKGMGLIGAAFGLGFVFGPLIGGLLAKFGYSVTGLASAGFSTLAFLLTLFLLPESLHRHNRTVTLEKKILDIGALKKIFNKKDLGLIIILFFVLTFSNANIYGTFALLGYKIYHFTDLQNGYIFGIIGLVSAIVQGGLIRSLSNIFGDKKLIIFGSIFMMFGLGLIPYGGNFLGLAFVSVVLAMGIGILQPTLLSLVSKVATDKEQGITLGINQSFSSFARVLGPLWGGFAFEYLGYPYPFLTGAGCTFVILLISIFYLPKIVDFEAVEFEHNTI